MARLLSGGKILLVLAVASLALAGCIFEYDSYTIDCAGFEIHVTHGEMTVDNSGSGYEIIGVRAVDGAGNTLYHRIREK